MLRLSRLRLTSRVLFLGIPYPKTQYHQEMPSRLTVSLISILNNPVKKKVLLDVRVKKGISHVPGPSCNSDAPNNEPPCPRLGRRLSVRRRL